MSDIRDYFDKVTVDTVENDQYESRTKTRSAISIQKRKKLEGLNLRGIIDETGDQC